MSDVKYNIKSNIPIRKQIAMKGTQKGAPYDPLKLATGGNVHEHIEDTHMDHSDREYKPKSKKLNQIMEREAVNHRELEKMLKKASGGKLGRMYEGRDPYLEKDAAYDSKEAQKLMRHAKLDNYAMQGDMDRDEDDRMEAKGGKWIQKAIKNPGALHRQLGVPQGKKIPEAKLEKATHSQNPTLAKRAHLAETLKGFKK